jgi:hypothetical protein
MPNKGSVIAYPYLWARQQKAGETEGRKARPVCLVLKLRDLKRDVHHLMLVAITSKPPSDNQVAVEVPDTERVRAKLTRYPRAWILVSEYNYDIAEESWYFEGSEEIIGTFSDPFVRQVTDALRKEMRAGAMRVDRTR